MTWLFPLYLLGAAAVIGPILMHLRRRPPQERVEFSSLMFLEAQTPMPVSKRRLEHWLLLLLRCLALILLALMFARPLWRQDDKVAASAHQALIVLMDRSASMQRGDLWSQATKAMTERLGTVSNEDRVAVAFFDREVQPLWTFTEDRESASSRASSLSQRLASVKPGWAATDLGQALVDTASWFTREPGMAGLKKRIVVISDFQEGSRLEALRSQVWPETVAVEVVKVSVKDAGNLSLSLAAASPELEETAQGVKPAAQAAPEKQAQAAKIRVRVANARDAQAQDFSLRWDKGGQETLTGFLPPGASRVMLAPPVADAKLAQVLHLEGDAWDFDNRVYIAPPQPKTVRLVFIGDEASRDEAASPLFYLSRALQATPTLRPELQVIPPTAVALPEATDIVFISGASVKGASPLSQSLKGFLTSGGMIVKVLDETTTAEEIASLSDVPAASLSLTTGSSKGDYLMLAEVDAKHPLLRPFADDRLRDFTKLRFWKHRGLTLKDEAEKQLQVIARFDNQAPAIATAALGKGALIVMTSGWHPADSQLALSTKFVPLLYGWLEAAGFRNEQAASLLVGDVLPVAAGAEVSIMTPDGQTVKPQAGEPVRASQAGLYTIQSKVPQVIAVNLPPEETRVTPLDPEKLRELGVLLKETGTDAATTAKAEERERLATSEQEGRQRAWFWLLASMLGVLGLETWLAGRIREGRAQAAYS